MINHSKKIISVILMTVLLTLMIFTPVTIHADTVRYKYGDVDLDGSITARDATFIQQTLANLRKLDELQKLLADVNLASSVDISDATLIQMWLAKLRTGFPSGEYYDAESETRDWRLSTISYEIFVRSFYDTNGDGIGDFRGVAAKADYLKSLNVGCVWLMPIYPTNSYHGYDVLNYTETNKQYGTLEDFDYMVNTLHDNGIKVIIDFVPNHSSVNHPWFTEAIQNPSSKYRDYYFISDKKGTKGSWHSRNGYFYRGDFSSSMPDLNYNNENVWNEMKEAAGFWLDRNVDGFRLDAVLHLDDNKNINHAFLQDFETYVKSKNSDAYVVGEVWDSTATIKPYYKDIDSCFDFEYGSSILRYAGGSRFYPVVKMNETNRIYTASANASPIKDKLTSINSIFITNHDQTRVASMVDTIEQAKLAGALLLTSKGMPFIYYGEELGQESNNSDNNRREPFDWYASANGEGMCNSNKWGIRPQFTTANDGISLEEELNDESSIYNYYVKLTKIRKDNPAFFTGTYTEVINTPLYGYTVTEEGSTSVFVAHNNTNETIIMTAAEGFTDLLNERTYSKGERVEIAPYSSVIVSYSGINNKYNPFE